LIRQLLGCVQELLNRVEQGVGLTWEEQCSIVDLQQLAVEVGVPSSPTLPVRPWLQHVEQVVLGQWPVPDQPDIIRCPYCGSSDVGRKSKQPRWKAYYDDAQRQVQRVAVYRYYCRNPRCARHSFTHLPAGLTLYSPYRIQFHLLALQMYAWGYSTYRRTSQALGVCNMTAWRWVSAWGYTLLPVAALFGVVRSSGVVGVDEKYVLVPKNDKPQAAMRRWMYVYMAVDVWSYDLLHIAIYPDNDLTSAHAFLLALRAKGYHPRVVITDLRQDYGPVIAQVFPAATHHECIFHALQNIQRHIKTVYGPDYARHHPTADQLKQAIYHIFDIPAAAEAQQRYQAVLALKDEYVAATPGAGVIFEFLERHWPKLVNAIGSDTIPATNNAVELVIRRFDQHYQNFCGFESIQSAECYLAVFEKLYRLTPFSQDAQPRVRGKSPLQLAGYPVANLPMATLCSGLSIDWPTGAVDVPNL
jgi:transposase-like protein